MAKVLGIGGIFFKSKNPLELAKWYKDNLGLDTQDWGGVIFANNPECSYSVWAPHDAATDYFQPSNNNYMINFAVDDLVQMINELNSKGIETTPIMDTEFGLFTHIIDPENNKIELWQAKK